MPPAKKKIRGALSLSLPLTHFVSQPPPSGRDTPQGPPPPETETETETEVRRSLTQLSHAHNVSLSLSSDLCPAELLSVLS